jgi:hypothetical protein
MNINTAFSNGVNQLTEIVKDDQVPAALHAGTALANGTPLSEDEQARLAKLETIVTRNMGAVFELGAALEEIRVRRLYRASHEKFEYYLHDVMRVSRAHGYRWIGFYKLRENLKDSGTNLLPMNESQARPLLPFKEEEQVTAWRMVEDKCKKGARLTASVVEGVAKHFRDAKKTGTTEKTPDPEFIWQGVQVDDHYVAMFKDAAAAEAYISLNALEGAGINEVNIGVRI